MAPGLRQVASCSATPIDRDVVVVGAEAVSEGCPVQVRARPISLVSPGTLLMPLHPCSCAPDPTRLASPSLVSSAGLGVRAEFVAAMFGEYSHDVISKEFQYRGV